ncbi:MAG: hypothetical protein HKN42_17205 [Granulosicoccus sp.]|nr:hypothetical protein [Granulosicoccus sp.]
MRKNCLQTDVVVMPGSNNQFPANRDIEQTFLYNRVGRARSGFSDTCRCDGGGLELIGDDGVQAGHWMGVFTLPGPDGSITVESACSQYLAGETAAYRTPGMGNRHSDHLQLSRAARSPRLEQVTSSAFSTRRPASGRRQLMD